MSCDDELQFGDGDSDIRTQIVRHADGRLLIIKTATSPRAARRLSNEMQMLTKANHPGVVELVDSTMSESHGELVLLWSGARTLNDVVALSPQEIAGVIASLANTVAHLHDLGIIHRRITADHVIIDPNGSPVLAGFGAATYTRAGSESPSDDVAAIGRLAMQLIEKASFNRPRWSIGRRSGWPQELSRIRQVAEMANDPRPQRRPTAHALAHAAHRSVRSASFISTTDSDNAPHEQVDRAMGNPNIHRSLKQDRSLEQIINPPDPPETDRADDQPAVIDSDPISELNSIINATRRRHRRQITARRAISVTSAAALTLALIAIFPFPEPVRPSKGSDGTGFMPQADTTYTPMATAPILEHGGNQFRLGEPGDIALVGDWHCTGKPIPAVIRPRTREIFIFDEWASASSPLVVDATTQLPPEVDPTTATADPNQCGTMLLARREGAAIALVVTNADSEYPISQLPTPPYGLGENAP